jgi:two-component system response regulator FlrC
MWSFPDTKTKIETSMARILVADDEEGIRSFLAEALAGAGHHVEEAADGELAYQALSGRAFHVVVTDLKMPKMDGMELVRRLRREQPEVEIIVLTAHGSVAGAVEAMKLGAFDYIEKPLQSPAALRLLVDRAIERRGLRDQGERTEAPAAALRLMWGAPVMAAVEAALGKVAATNATVLLTGESGTGKEVAAQWIHSHSRRAAGPFVAVNCATLSDQLLESDLFGHEKGSFTGAVARRRGKIELAEGGTFFLDEIGELRPDLQTKLLRVLQERRYERVGGTCSLEADVRWIAATNRDLPAEIRAGRFREDLYHRLAVFPIRMPSLRERREDIPFLADALLSRIAKEIGRPGLRLDEDAKRVLAQAEWPGNVRELGNALERAAILDEGSVITTAALTWLLGAAQAPSSAAKGESMAEAPTMEEAERTAILRALAQFAGNRRKAAEHLGIGQRTLYEKLKRYGIR